MQSISIRNTYRLKNKLTLFLNQYKIVILFSSLMLILGLALGVYTALKYSGEIELSNLSDVCLVEFLKGDKGIMGLFFPYMFKFLFCISVIIFFNFKPILSICSYLLLTVRGYINWFWFNCNNFAIRICWSFKRFCCYYSIWTYCLFGFNCNFGNCYKPKF